MNQELRRTETTHGILDHLPSAHRLPTPSSPQQNKAPS